MLQSVTPSLWYMAPAIASRTHGHKNTTIPSVNVIIVYECTVVHTTPDIILMLITYSK